MQLVGDPCYLRMKRCKTGKSLQRGSPKLIVSKPSAELHFQPKRLFRLRTPGAIDTRLADQETPVRWRDAEWDLRRAAIRAAGATSTAWVQL